MAEVAKQGGLVESGFSPGVIGSKATLVGGASEFSFESGRSAFCMFLALAPAATGLSGISPELILTTLPAAVRPVSPVRYSVTRIAPGRRALAEVVSLLDDEPIESGVTHPAETQLSAYLSKFGAGQVFGVLSELGPSARAASLLRLLGRSEALSADLRGQILSWGLASPNIEVRDASVQAAENWNDAALAKVLRAHREPIAWLKDYADAVADDLEG